MAQIKWGIFLSFLGIFLVLGPSIYLGAFLMMIGGILIYTDPDSYDKEKMRKDIESLKNEIRQLKNAVIKSGIDVRKERLLEEGGIVD